MTSLRLDYTSLTGHTLMTSSVTSVCNARAGLVPVSILAPAQSWGYAAALLGQAPALPALRWRRFPARG